MPEPTTDPDLSALQPRVLLAGDDRAALSLCGAALGGRLLLAHTSDCDQARALLDNARDCEPFAVACVSGTGAAELVRREMGAAYQLDPRLEVDIGVGRDWLDTK